MSKTFNPKSWYTESMKKSGNGLSFKPVLYYILNFTWGLPLTLLGIILTICLLPFARLRRFNYIYYVELRKDVSWGFAMGTMFVVGKYSSARIKDHEFGHTVQNAILGPLMIFLVALPSVFRFWYRRHRRKIGRLPKVPYDSIWFEHTATVIGDTYSFVHSNER